MHIDPGSAFYKGAYAQFDVLGTKLPLEYTGARDEFLACRSTAWLGGGLNTTPVYDVSGPDAAALLTRLCVNRDFPLMQPGDSKHAIMCNDKGNMIADGVIMYKGGDLFRTYWMAPVLAYFVGTSDLDVKGEWRSDEYFFQIDGPKSLEILEEATQTDLHDIAFAKNKTVEICGTEMVVHRLGMSGCLAYEVHGDEKDFEVAYARIREVTERFGGRVLGARNYLVLNHTPAGYPNQTLHYLYDTEHSDPGFTAFTRENCIPQIAWGSTSVCPEIMLVTPYDVGWGNIVNMNHEFVGKEALVAARKERKRTIVTLEWDTDDVGDVFMSQFRGRDVEPYEPIETYHDTYNASTRGIRGDLVLSGNDVVGFAAGRCYAFYERRMISLACISTDLAAEGTELDVLWGCPEFPQKRIRARVAQFPYYDEIRNETFDVESIPHPAFA